MPVVVPSTAAAIGGSEVDSTLSYDDDSWKKEYDAQVRIWRAHHAEQREKAEKERLRWEAIRDQEKEEAKRRKAAGFTDEPTSLTTQGESWEQTGASSTTGASTAAAASQIFGPTGNVEIYFRPFKFSLTNSTVCISRAKTPAETFA